MPDDNSNHIRAMWQVEKAKAKKGSQHTLWPGMVLCTCSPRPGEADRRIGFLKVASAT